MSPRAGLDLNRIIAKAAEIADTEGLEAVTLASLAQKLGVRSPSLYNHVEGLSALRAHLAVRGLKMLNDSIQQATMEREGKEAIAAIADAYLLFAKNHPGLYLLTLQASINDAEEYARQSDEMINRLLNALSPFGLSKEEGIHVLRGLRSLLHGFASIEGQGGFGMPIGTDDSLRYVLNCFLTGLCHQS